jgi:hypothetical protein
MANLVFFQLVVLWCPFFEPLQPLKLPLQKKKRRTTDEVFLKIA